MTTRKLLKYLFFFLTITLATSCDKETEWLDEKSNKQSVVPETLKDFQALMDNTDILNKYYSFSGNIGTDNFYLPDEDIGNLREDLLNIYRWDKVINWTQNIAIDWNDPYTVIAYANLVIEGLYKINSDQQGYYNLLGQAYFYRAFAYLNLSQIFCKPYNLETAQTDLGLPIRLYSDVNIIQQRSNLSDLYHQIIDDAEKSLQYLDQTPKYIQRPSKPAANALLARTYLLMDNFEKALLYADEVLTKSELIDFNNPSQVSHSFAYKFPENGKNNPEILFFVISRGGVFSLNYMGNYVQANRQLYDMYDPNDLRKEYFFGIDDNDNIKFVSTYGGTGYSFGGLSVNETLMIRAECLTRIGRIKDALSDLNRLLINRYRTGTFIPYETMDKETLLTLIFQEKRKELPNVGNVRWEDLRRLNKKQEYQVTLSRVINGETLTLPPGDPRYVLPISIKEIQQSGIEQNIR